MFSGTWRVCLDLALDPSIVSILLTRSAPGPLQCQEFPAPNLRIQTQENRRLQMIRKLSELRQLRFPPRLSPAVCGCRVPDAFCVARSQERSSNREDSAGTEISYFGGTIDSRNVDPSDDVQC